MHVGAVAGGARGHVGHHDRWPEHPGSRSVAAPRCITRCGECRRCRCSAWRRGDHQATAVRALGRGFRRALPTCGALSAHPIESPSCARERAPQPRPHLRGAAVGSHSIDYRWGDADHPCRGRATRCGPGAACRGGPVRFCRCCGPNSPSRVRRGANTGYSTSHSCVAAVRRCNGAAQARGLRPSPTATRTAGVTRRARGALQR